MTVLHAHILSIEEVNAMSQSTFVNVFGPVFEHSPWIAHKTWFRRPFHNREQILKELVATVRKALPVQRIDLIKAHPDIAGRLGQQHRLTRASAEEQAKAGLDQLTAEELKLFKTYNARYKAKFGFPFVICARLNDKQTILLAFQRRLELSAAEEIETALDEIEKIATLRLAQLMRG